MLVGVFVRVAVLVGVFVRVAVLLGVKVGVFVGVPQIAPSDTNPGPLI